MNNECMRSFERVTIRSISEFIRSKSEYFFKIWACPFDTPAHRLFSCAHLSVCLCRIERIYLFNEWIYSLKERIYFQNLGMPVLHPRSLIHSFNQFPSASCVTSTNQINQLNAQKDRKLCFLLELRNIHWPCDWILTRCMKNSKQVHKTWTHVTASSCAV